MVQGDTLDDLKWYTEKRPEYEQLSERVSNILHEILTLRKANFAFVNWRAKTLLSFQAKIEAKDYSGPEMPDLAGIRVVGYVKSDVDKIVQIVRDTFSVDESKSKDKSAELGVDKVGYRSIHLICTLPDQRIALPEYAKFNGMFFEIQVRTILEHAWAEIEHDRNYKYKGLPLDIQRELRLFAGLLESADRNIHDITTRIEKYEQEIKEKTETGKLREISIDPLTLKQFIIEEFGEKLNVEPSYGGDGAGNSVVKELNYFGIKEIAKLQSIIPENFTNIVKTYRSENERNLEPNLSGIVFALLILEYGEKYYEIAKETRNPSPNPEGYKFEKSKFNEYLRRYRDARANSALNS